MTFSINDTLPFMLCHYAECCHLCIVMLNVVILIVVRLSVVSVISLSVVMLNVFVPKRESKFTTKKFNRLTPGGQSN